MSLTRILSRRPTKGDDLFDFCMFLNIVASRSIPEASQFPSRNVTLSMSGAPVNNFTKTMLGGVGLFVFADYSPLASQLRLLTGANTRAGHIVEPVELGTSKPTAKHKAAHYE